MLKIKPPVVLLTPTRTLEVARSSAALYLAQWRAGRMRISTNRRDNGTRAYYCRYSGETLVVPPTC